MPVAFKARVRDLRSKIQKNLILARESQGYTRGELEKLAQIPKGSLVKLETGVSLDVHLGILIRACFALGMTLSDMTGEKRASISQREYQLLKLYRQMNVIFRRRFIYVGMAMLGELDDPEENIRLSVRRHGSTLGRSRKDLDERQEFDSIFGSPPKEGGENDTGEESEECQNFPMELEQEKAIPTE